MSAEAEALRTALDEVQNPFGRPTRAQEKLVLDAAERWASALSTPPADDVREALAEVIRSHALTTHIFGKVDAGELADAIRATFEVRPRGTVTDAEVEAALNAYLRLDDELARTASAVAWRRHNESHMRDALEAARGVRS